MFEQFPATSAPQVDNAARWEAALSRAISQAWREERSPLLALALWLTKRKALAAAPQAAEKAERAGRGRYMYPLE